MVVLVLEALAQHSSKLPYPRPLGVGSVIKGQFFFEMGV